MPPYPFSIFEIQKNYQNEPKFYDIYSRNNLPKIKYMTYVMNLQRYKSIGTQWVVLYADSNNVSSFDSLGVEYISHDIGNFINTSKWFNKWVDNFALDLLILCPKEKVR